MTLFYPDLSNFNDGVVLKGARVACLLVTEGTSFADPDLTVLEAAAKLASAWYFGYHFMTEGNGAGQAHAYFSRAGRLPAMIDWEPDQASIPTALDVIQFVTTLRALGGRAHLLYLPRWFWQELGSPSLHAMTQARLHLVSSDYTTYSDDGVGWQPYGGMTPVIWQYSDSQLLNGRRVDYNAFKGTVPQLKALVRGEPDPSHGTIQGDDEMNIAADETTKSLGWTAGSAKSLVFVCGSKNVQTLRVTQYTDAHGISAPVTLTVHNGRAVLQFTEKDVYAAYVERQGPAAEYAQLWAHTAS